MVFGLAAFQDNYIWIIKGGNQRSVAVVDPGDAAPVIELLDRQGLSLAAILITHHHADHAAGIQSLLEHALVRHGQARVPVFGPVNERIAGVDITVKEGDTAMIDAVNCKFSVLDVPGHTAGHIAYFGHLDSVGPVLFCGDTLFAGGCGRLFEGTAEQMWASLQKLAALPPDTAVYCAHEYTLSNLRFAAHAMPDEPEIAARLADVVKLRAIGKATVPSSIALERRTNPFLLCKDVAGFAALRLEKDSFRG